MSTINPFTGRKIKKNSATHKKLIKKIKGMGISASDVVNVGTFALENLGKLPVFDEAHKIADPIINIVQSIAPSKVLPSIQFKEATGLWTGSYLFVRPFDYLTDLNGNPDFSVYSKDHQDAFINYNRYAYRYYKSASAFDSRSAYQPTFATAYDYATSDAYNPLGIGYDYYVNKANWNKYISYTKVITADPKYEQNLNAYYKALVFYGIDKELNNWIATQQNIGSQLYNIFVPLYSAGEEDMFFERFPISPYSTKYITWSDKGLPNHAQPPSDYTQQGYKPPSLPDVFKNLPDYHGQGLKKRKYKKKKGSSLFSSLGTGRYDVSKYKTIANKNLKGKGFFDDEFDLADAEDQRENQLNIFYNCSQFGHRNAKKFDNNEIIFEQPPVLYRGIKIGHDKILNSNPPRYDINGEIRSLDDIIDDIHNNGLISNVISRHVPDNHINKDLIQHFQIGDEPSIYISMTSDQRIAREYAFPGDLVLTIHLNGEAFHRLNQSLNESEWDIMGLIRHNEIVDIAVV